MHAQHDNVFCYLLRARAPTQEHGPADMGSHCVELQEDSVWFTGLFLIRATIIIATSLDGHGPLLVHCASVAPVVVQSHDDLVWLLQAGVQYM